MMMEWTYTVLPQDGGGGVIRPISRRSCLRPHESWRDQGHDRLEGKLHLTGVHEASECIIDHWGGTDSLYGFSVIHIINPV